MAASSTSAIYIINAPLYVGSKYSRSFSTATSVVLNVTDTLSNLIWREVVRASASMKCANSGIKSARDENDLDVLHLLSLPVSVFLQATNGENIRELHVVFDQTRQQSITKKNALSMLIAASK